METFLVFGEAIGNLCCRPIINPIERYKKYRFIILLWVYSAAVSFVVVVLLLMLFSYSFPVIKT